MNASNFRYVAREALRGKWPVSILVAFVAMLLGANAGGGSISLDMYDDMDDIDEITHYGSEMRYDLMEEFSEVPFLGGMAGFVIGAAITTVLLILMVALALFIIGAAVELGLKLYNIRLVTQTGPHSFSTLFERFPIFARALGLRLCMALFIFLWSLLFVIPGIIATYRYAMAPYLMAQYPEMGIREAMDRSKELMAGNKWRLFCLQISFIGWSILAAIPFGFGFLLLNPYIYAAECAFYLELTNQLPVQTA